MLEDAMCRNKRVISYTIDITQKPTFENVQVTPFRLNISNDAGLKSRLLQNLSVSLN